MRRRDLLLAPLALPLRAQRYRSYSRVLPEYLARLAREAYGKRNRALEALRSPADVAARQQWVRRTFWRLVGGMPEPAPLRVQTTGAFERDGYRVEKLVYEGLAGMHIPANLYLPKSGKPPYPGVLFQMGHSLNGKAAEPYQKCCQGLAQLGYVVLAFDPMGQGERTYYPKPGGTLTRLESADEEHSRPGRQMLLVGQTATRLQVWDAVRSLDVLASHPLVDARRLASTGNSGGGTLTMMLAAVDDRLAAAAVSCGNTENFACADFNPPGSVDDAEQNFPGAGPLGFDRWDLLYPLAPKPLLITVSARDFFGTYSPSYLTSGDEEFAKLRRVYGLLGQPERLEWYDSPLPHGLTPNMRAAIYGFFEKHLRGSDRKVEEPPVRPEPEEVLYAGPTGNVVRDFGSLTPRPLAKAPAARQSADLRELLGVERAAGRASKLASTWFGAIEIQALEIESAPGVFLPAWLYVALKPGPLLMILEPQGRNARWKEDDLYHRLAARGCAVCAFDVRGIGDLSPEVGRGNPYYTRPHSGEEAYAWASMILGRPLIGQRVTDILAVAEALRGWDAVAGRRRVLAARGLMTPPALWALAIEAGIGSGYLAGGLRSYAALLETDDYEEPFANFLPGVLRHTDLDELRRLAGERVKSGTAWSLDVLSAL